MVYIDTSGYSYDGWIGRSYPRDIPRNQMLRHDARHFECVKIDYNRYNYDAQAVQNARLCPAMLEEAGARQALGETWAAHPQ